MDLRQLDEESQARYWRGLEVKEESDGVCMDCVARQFGRVLLGFRKLRDKARLSHFISIHSGY